MSEPRTDTPPVDRQQITLPSAFAIAALTFGVGAGWTVHEGRISQLETSHREEREERKQTAKLLNRICIKVGCDAQGMRE